MRARDHRLAGRDRGERPAFGFELRSGRAVQGARDAAADPQLRVGRVDDRVHVVLARNVAPHALDRDAEAFAFNHGDFAAAFRTSRFYDRLGPAATR